MWLLTSFGPRRITWSRKALGLPVGLGISLEVLLGACVRREGARLEDHRAGCRLSSRGSPAAVGRQVLNGPRGASLT
jgi:hypothetical protein